MTAPVVGTYTTANYSGGYPYAPRVTHDATGASALVVFVTSAGGYSWNPTATFNGVAMTMLARSTSVGGQGVLWIFGLASPPQVSGLVAVDKANEYGDIGVVTAISVSGTGPAPFGETVAGYGNASVVLDVDITGEALLLGAAHDHYTSGATMTTPAAATVVYSNRTNTNHQQYGFSKTQATAGNVTMTFSTAFNSIGAGLVSIRGPLPREVAKPSGTLTASKTGQFAALRAFYAFNEASGDTANLANAADQLTITGGSRATDGVGRYYIPGGTALSTFVSSAKSNADLDIAPTQNWTIFARCAPVGFSEGVDRTLLAVGTATTGFELNIYGTVWELSSGGGFYPICERPATQVQTIVASYVGSTGVMSFYVNGVFQAAHTLALAHVGTSKLSVGHDQRAAFASFADKVYEVGIVATDWTATEAAAYDSAPLAMLGGAPAPTNYDLTVASLDTGAPAPDRPVLSVVAPPVNVALTVAAFATTAPAPTRPAFSQGHTFTTTALAPAAPTAARLALVQSHLLIADELVWAPPVPARPVVTQTHALTALDAVNASPEPGRPVLAQDYALAPLGLTAEAPAPDRPAVTQDHRLAGQTLSTPAPVVAPTAISQTHVLAAPPVTAAAPEPGRPSLAGAVDLAVSDLIAASPALDQPVLSQAHIYSVSSLTGSAPILAQPVLSQTRVLTIADLTAPAPILSGPAVTQVHNLAPAALVTAPPQVPILPFGGSHVVSATEVTAPAPILAKPGLTQRHLLAAPALATGPAALGSPAILQAGQIAPAPVTTGGPTLGRPTLIQVYHLAAADLLTAVPDLGSVSLGQIHPLETGDLDGPAPILGRPPLVARVALAVASFASPAPIADRPVAQQGHRLTAAAVLPPAASLPRPGLRQLHRLTILDLATGQPIVGRATLLTRLPVGEPRPQTPAALPRPLAPAAASRPTVTAAEARGFTIPRSEY